MLAAGSRLGSYEILAPIGAGGMGEVYRARDPRVGRDVAIKVAAAQFSERFEREARAVAALNHPNICTLFDVGPDYLVMELVEGESPKGPLPLEEALRIARQVATALAAAHEKGIVHRDLKPDNIKIKPDGTVKVLDFGLAKQSPEIDPIHLSNSPTISQAATRAGVILGTAAYMAPEQARGRPVDKRADIWAFGVVLYELLTGKRLFQGEDVTETLASVVKDKPDLSGVPIQVRPLLERCLEKDPLKRLRDIGDMDLLVGAAPGPARGDAAAPPRFGRVGWALAGLLAVALVISLWAPWRTPAAQPGPVRFGIYPPPKTAFTNWLTLSPDGRKIAFTARGEDGRVQLWIRPVDTLQAEPLTPTSTQPAPFWSPDSQYIAYQLNGKLLKIEASGGPPQTLCDAPNNFQGGSWSPAGDIVFSGPDGLMRVAAAGGVSARLTALDKSRQETAHESPVFLQDGRRFLYLRRSSVDENNGIYIGSLDEAPEKQDSRRLMGTRLNALYSPPLEGGKSQILFLRDNTLMAQPFDSSRLELAGEAVPVVNSVNNVSGKRVVAEVSANNVLTYRTGGPVDQAQLTWFDRGGKVSGVLGDFGTFNGGIALSPDGTRVVAPRLDNQGNADLWTMELGRSLSTRFTFDKARDFSPFWSPDGRRIVFGSDREGLFHLYWKVSDGASNEEMLFKSGENKFPLDWSRDGKYLLYVASGPKDRGDLWFLPMREGERKPTRFLGTEYNENSGRFSPDGRFVAYTSDESGRQEIYVRSFPEGGGKWQVSREGGQQPRWRRDGKELFYLTEQGSVMSAEVAISPAFQPGTPRLLFSATVVITGGFDISPDGKKFLLPVPTKQSGGDPITVVLNWQALLKK